MQPTGQVGQNRQQQQDGENVDGDGEQPCSSAVTEQAAAELDRGDHRRQHPPAERAGRSHDEGDGPLLPADQVSSATTIQPRSTHQAGRSDPRNVPARDATNGAAGARLPDGLAGGDAWPAGPRGRQAGGGPQLGRVVLGRAEPGLERRGALGGDLVDVRAQLVE